MLKVLIACEESQAVCIEFRKLGFEAYSCDILPCSGGHSDWHIQGDGIKALYSHKWDLVIAHPPCTFLSNSGVRWLVSKTPKLDFEYCENIGLYLNYKRYKEVEEGAKFFNHFVLYGKLGNKISIENPIQHKYAKELINSSYSQLIQPWQFGHKESKATCLWNFNIPNLIETENVYLSMMDLPYPERAKIHYAPPGRERAKIRSKTYTGIASAMAEQWGEYLLLNEI